MARIRTSLLGSLCACIGSIASAAPPSQPPMPSQEEMQQQILQMMGKTAPPKRESPEAVEVVVQSGHAAAITAVAVSDDGRSVASGSMDESVKLWDVASGQAVRTFAGDGVLWPTAVAFTPDGSRLIVTDTESARVYDTSSGTQLLRFVADGSLPVVSADGRVIAVTAHGDPPHERSRQSRAHRRRQLAGSRQQRIEAAACPRTCRIREPTRYR